MAADIDFKEIEKAMAELVNKSQSQTRKKQLTKVVKKRDEIAKKAENSREQGRVATKRIIIGNKNLRSSVVNAEENSKFQTPRTPRANPTTVITDFKTSKPFIAPAPELPPAPEPEEANEDTKLNTSIGDLSDDFLKEEVTASDSTNPLLPEENLAEPEFIEPETQAPEQIQSVPPLTTPPPVPEPPTEEVEAESDPLADLIPEAEPAEVPTPAPEPETNSPIYNPNSGAVHRMYGQRMKTPVAATPVQNQSQNLPTPQKQKKKKGFLFYFVLLLTLAALGVWGYVGYIFFVPKS